MRSTSRLKSKILVIVSVVMSAVGIMPALMGTASAAQFTNRKLELESAQVGSVGQNIWHDFTFTSGAAGTDIGSFEFLYCQEPLGTCTAPTGLDFTTNGVTIATQTIGGGAPTNAFTIDVTGGDTTANRLRLETTGADATGVSEIVNFRFDNIENPTDSGQTPLGNNTFFVRISTFSDLAYTTGIDDGTVAAALTDLLTITARVQEILHFCVGSLETGYAITGEDCSTDVTTEGATVDLGPIDGAGVTTPVVVVNNTTTDDRDGAFMLRTNANVGATVSYYSVAFGGGTQGNLKKTGTNCGANAAADGCFDSSNTGAAIATNTEWFGMRLINEDAASAVPTSALTATAPYNSGTDYTWEMTTTSIDQVASAAAAVDDEAFLLRFAAVTALTTPTGSYSTSADFIAVATY